MTNAPAAEGFPRTKTRTTTQTQNPRRRLQPRRIACATTSSPRCAPLPSRNYQNSSRPRARPPLGLHTVAKRGTRAPKDVVGCVHYPPPQAGRCPALIIQHAHAPHARARAHPVHRPLLRRARSARRTTRARSRAEWGRARRRCAKKVRATRKAEPRWKRWHANVGVLRTASGPAARFVRGS
jgi:hypothetical protein